MFIITNRQLKKIVGPQIFYWDTAFKNTDFIALTIGTSEDKKMLKLSFWDEDNPSYKENHFLEDYEEILKTIEEVLLFPAYEKHSEKLKYCEEIFKELDETFSSLGRKCTTYEEYLRRRDCYIKAKESEVLRFLTKITGKPVPEFLQEKIKQEISKREDKKLTIFISKLTDFEHDDRLAFNISPAIYSQILTVHGNQDFIEDRLLKDAYNWGFIEKEELFERIDELSKIFKVKKDKKYFENTYNLNKYFLDSLKGSFLIDTKTVNKITEDVLKKYAPQIKMYEDLFKPAGVEIYTGQRCAGKTLAQMFFDEINKDAIRGEKEMNNNKTKNKPQRPDSIMFDKENKITIAFLNGKKFTIKCDEKDKYDYRIGLGIVVSKINDNNNDLKYLRDHMAWKEYYLYCYNKFFYFNTEKIKAFENAVFAENEQFKLKLDEEKVRKFKCEEIEKVQYKPKKITHDFILINPGA